MYRCDTIRSVSKGNIWMTKLQFRHSESKGLQLNIKIALFYWRRSNVVNCIFRSDFSPRSRDEVSDQMHFEIINCIRLFSSERCRLLIKTFVKNKLEI